MNGLHQNIKKRLGTWDVWMLVCGMCVTGIIGGAAIETFKLRFVTFLYLPNNPRRAKTKTASHLQEELMDSLWNMIPHIEQVLLHTLRRR